MKIYDIMKQKLYPIIEESLSIMPNNKKNVLNLDNLKNGHSGYIQWYILKDMEVKLSIDNGNKSSVLLNSENLIDYFNNGSLEEKKYLLEKKHNEAQEIMKNICSDYIEIIKQNQNAHQSQLSRICGIKDNIMDNDWIIRTINSLLMEQNIIKQNNRNNKAYFEVLNNNKTYELIPFIMPKCNMSKLEAECAIVSYQLNLEFRQQVTIPGCKYKKLLKFDFYYPEYDLYVEIDGKQHYELTPLFHKNVEQYVDQILRDRTKDLFVYENELNFLRIRYDENIKQKLQNKIDKLSK